MRHAVSIIIIAMVIFASTSITPDNVQGQFATNTPMSDSAGSQPTEGLGFGGFATNTPSGPTFTPTFTATPLITSTPTATITPSPTATFTPTITPSPTPIPLGPASYPENVNPLTGLEYPDQAARERRNLIVKISNFPPIVRPQHGLNAADLMYEYEAEGGVTRFAAIYRSTNPERVGSVRSARLLDIELSTMYRALLAYSGTSEPIQRLLLDPAEFFEFQLISPLVGHPEDQNNNCRDNAFCRDTSLIDTGTPREHTLFGNTNRMWDIATRQNTNTGYKAFGLAFSETPSQNGELANDIFIDWYGQTDARWQYNAIEGVYERYTDGVPHFDAADGQQVWADNLIVIVVPHVERPDLFPPGVNYQSIGVELWDQGQAYVFREGFWYQGFWRRKDFAPGSALQLTFGDNTPITLKPGRSWISVVRGFGDVRVSEEFVDLAATATIQAMTPTVEPLDFNPDN